MSVANGFLPMTIEEVQQLGIEQLDFVYSQGTPMWITLLLDMRSSHGCFRHMAIMSES